MRDRLRDRGGGAAAVAAAAPGGGRPRRSIGERVAALVRDGATLQRASVRSPTPCSPRSRAGAALRCGRRCSATACWPGPRRALLTRTQPVTASFAFGSADLYAWMTATRTCGWCGRRRPTTRRGSRGSRGWSRSTVRSRSTCSPRRTRRWVNGRIYSGFGGQTDFVVGALHSPGGQAIIALPSWHPKAGVSTVVPKLAGPVTSFQHSFIVSEQGTAAIWGHDASARPSRSSRRSRTHGSATSCARPGAPWVSG